MPSDQLDRHSRRAPAQPEERLPCDPPRPARRAHGRFGSGKCSLAFDTLFAEGQRRYVESLSAYARQFLEQMEKPDVDQIEGLSPAISIEQKTTSQPAVHRRDGHGDPRLPEAPLRLHRPAPLPGLRPGDRAPDGPADGRPGLRDARGDPPPRPRPARQGPQDRGRPVFEADRKQGFVRVRVDGEQSTWPRRATSTSRSGTRSRSSSTASSCAPERDERAPPTRARLADSLETALRLGEGVVVVAPAPREGEAPVFEEPRSRALQLPVRRHDDRRARAGSFSFNSPYGACPTCTGIGTVLVIDPDLVIPDRAKSVAAGALVPVGADADRGLLADEDPRGDLREHGWDIRAPVRDLPPEAVDTSSTRRRRRRSTSASGTSGASTRLGHLRGAGHHLTALPRDRRSTSRQRSRSTWSPALPGLRRPPAEAGGARRDDRRAEHPRVDEDEGDDAMAGWSLPGRLTERERAIARMVLKEIEARLGFLADVGLDYLTIDRAARRSRGARRSGSASRRRSALAGGRPLHPRRALHRAPPERQPQAHRHPEGLRDLGNTVLVVEHDEETIRTADRVVDLGPGAGDTAARSSPRAARGDPRRAALHHRGLPPGELPVRSRPAAGPGAGRRSSCAAPASTTSGDRRRLPARPPSWR